MKIVYASASLIPSRYANAVHVMKMCQAFAKNGHNVVLLALIGSDPYIRDEKEIFDYYGVDPCFTIRRPWTLQIKAHSLFLSMPSIREIMREKPDLVYARNLFSAYLSVRLGNKTIYEIHTPQEEGGAIGNWLLGSMMGTKSLLRLVVISDALKKRVSERFGDKKILVAHDGADIIDENRLNSSLASWPGRKGTIKVGYIGNLYPGRGIEIIYSLAESFKELDFYIIGGSDKDISRWKSKTLPDNLFFQGFLPHRIIVSLLKELDILLMPYQKKVGVPGMNDTSLWMSPIKMFEYMSSGKAIISSDHGVLKEVLRHGENALLVAPDNIEEWKTALQRLILEPGLREGLGRQALNDLQEHYTWGKRAVRVLEGIII